MRISDWSSDVCSSDLQVGRLDGIAVDAVVALKKAGDALIAEIGLRRRRIDLFVQRERPARKPGQSLVNELPLGLIGRARDERSEERRVGKECVSTCRSRWSTYQ